MLGNTSLNPASSGPNTFTAVGSTYNAGSPDHTLSPVQGTNNTQSGSYDPLLDPNWVHGVEDEWYKIEAIVDTRKNSEGEREYRVRWAGDWSGDDKYSWVDEINCLQSAIVEYQDKMAGRTQAIPSSPSSSVVSSSSDSSSSSSSSESSESSESSDSSTSDSSDPEADGMDYEMSSPSDGASLATSPAAPPAASPAESPVALPVAPPVASPVASPPTQPAAPQQSAGLEEATPVARGYRPEFNMNDHLNFDLEEYTNQLFHPEDSESEGDAEGESVGESE